MRSRIQCLGSCLIVFTLLLFAGSAAAEDVSPRCEAAMDRAVGHYSQCLLSVAASNARHENATKLANRQARCEARFDRRTSRAFSRYGADECPSSEHLGFMADRTVTYAQGAATEAGGEDAAVLLFVQNAVSGTLSETTLVLSGIDGYTGWFTDRPYRKAGRMTTADFVALFYEEGANSFAENPPNADFACEVGGETVNEIVMLTEPVLDEAAGTLTYTTVIVSSGGDFYMSLEGGLECDHAHLFIDSVVGTHGMTTTDVQALLSVSLEMMESQYPSPGCEQCVLSDRAAVESLRIALHTVLYPDVPVTSIKATSTYQALLERYPFGTGWWSLMEAYLDAMCEKFGVCNVDEYGQPL